MAMVFKSADDAAEAVELVGAGKLDPGGKGGVPVADAAVVMSELQEKNADGSLVLDDKGQAVPLSGAKLTAAAKQFADDRGLQVVNLNDEAIAGLPEEVGLPPDRPPAAEVAAENYKQMFGTTEAWQGAGMAGSTSALPVFNDNADHNVQGQPPYTEPPSSPAAPAEVSPASAPHAPDKKKGE